MENIPPHVKALMNDRSLSMNQKLVSFMMVMDPKILPDNPINAEFHELGKDIKRLIDDNKIKITGFDNNFNIKVITI